jgi:hypothetical protein
MVKKPVDRRSGEKPIRPGRGTYQPDREPGRMHEDLQGPKGFEKPEGRPIDKPFPAPGSGGTHKDVLDGGKRSDREFGRPVQLEADEGRFERRKAR